MCKILAISRTDELNRKQLDLILRRTNLRFQETEPDGFGWALAPRRRTADAPHPQHIIERFVAPASFGGLDGGLRRYDMLDDVTANALDRPDASYGMSLPADFSPSGPLVIHGRKATGVIALDNTHPFHKHGWTLVHNGVVEEVRVGHYDTETTCDSEHLLNCFAFGDGPAEFAKRVRGKYAVAVLSPDNKLHISKNYLADLWTAQTSKLGWVFATDPRDLFSLCKLVDAGRPVPVPVANGRHIVVGRNGAIESSEHINHVSPISARPFVSYNRQGDQGWRHHTIVSPGAS